MARMPSRSMSPQRDADEGELVAACRRGERWAQRRLFDQHHKAVYRALLALSGNSGDAEDLLQETFLKAYGAIGAFRGHSSVRTWLMRIGTNTFYEDRRRRLTRRRHLDRMAHESRAAALRVVPGRSETHGRQRELRDLVLRALSMLRTADRTMLTLYDIEGYRYAEIAEILDIAPGTVGSRLSRARERLAAAIRDLLGIDAEETLTREHLYGRRERGARDEPGGHRPPPRNGES